MRTRRWPIGLGVVLAAAVLVALLRPRPQPTPFESGYGLTYVGQRVTGRGGLREVTRYFASPEGLDAVAHRLDRENAVSTALPLTRLWMTDRGLVTAHATRPRSAPDGDWPDGTRTFLTTFEATDATLLQRIARSVGIRL